MIVIDKYYNNTQKIKTNMTQAEIDYLINDKKHPILEVDSIKRSGVITTIFFKSSDKDFKIAFNLTVNRGEFIVVGFDKSALSMQYITHLIKEYEKNLESKQTKDLTVLSNVDAKEKINDVEIYGIDMWTLLCKASSKSGNWMKSTKAMQIGKGVLIQVTTQQGDNVAEALQFIDKCKISLDADGLPYITAV